MRRPGLAWSVLLPLALLVGCGGAGDLSGSGPATSEEPSAAPRVCEVFPAAEAGAVSGLTLTAREGPLDVCEYGQDDPRATSFTLGAQLESELAGGAQAYLDSLTSGITLDEERAPDVGEQARVVTGEVSGFRQTAGAALADGVLYTVNLTPGDDLDTVAELALAEELLRALVATA